MNGLAMALLGSGEFEPWTEPIDRWLLARSPRQAGPVLILPLASAPEGGDVFDRWGDMGLAHYGELGIPAQVVAMRTREDADRGEFVELLASASGVFFSGGNPAYMARALTGSAFWAVLCAEMRAGLPYAGCSAGVNSLGQSALDSTALAFGREPWQPGLRLFPTTWFGVHWDMVDTYIPGARDFIIGSVPPDCRLVSVDERTAMVGDGSEWSVLGTGRASVLEEGAWREFGPGERFALDLPMSFSEPAPA
jgi:cyanophycinase-like exopeptidase